MRMATPQVFIDGAPHDEEAQTSADVPLVTLPVASMGVAASLLDSWKRSSVGPRSSAPDADVDDDDGPSDEMLSLVSKASYQAPADRPNILTDPRSGLVYRRVESPGDDVRRVLWARDPVDIRSDDVAATGPVVRAHYPMQPYVGPGIRHGLVIVAIAGSVTDEDWDNNRRQLMSGEDVFNNTDLSSVTSTVFGARKQAGLSPKAELILVGHSRSGYLAQVAASKLGALVTGTVTWNAAGTMSRLPGHAAMPELPNVVKLRNTGCALSAAVTTGERGCPTFAREREDWRRTASDDTCPAAVCARQEWYTGYTSAGLIGYHATPDGPLTYVRGRSDAQSDSASGALLYGLAAFAHGRVFQPDTPGYNISSGTVRGVAAATPALLAALPAAAGAAVLATASSSSFLGTTGLLASAAAHAVTSEQPRRIAAAKRAWVAAHVDAAAPDAARARQKVFLSTRIPKQTSLFYADTSIPDLPANATRKDMVAYAKRLGIHARAIPTGMTAAQLRAKLQASTGIRPHPNTQASQAARRTDSNYGPLSGQFRGFGARA